MSQQTKSEVLAQLRRQYRRAGRDYKRQLLDQAQALLGYHRKAAIRALGHKPRPPAVAALILGRRREYQPIQRARADRQQTLAHVGAQAAMIRLVSRQPFGQQRHKATATGLKRGEPDGLENG